MTIKFERDALLRVLEQRPPSHLALHPPSGRPIGSDDHQHLHEEDCVFIDVSSVFRKNTTPHCVEDLRDSTVDDDTLSTTSLSMFSDDSDDSSQLLERRVSFASTMVTDEWTRPTTPKEDIPRLFYSTEETHRFRQEYRLERKLLHGLSIDPETCPLENEKLCAFMATSSPSRHAISRVVVVHNDKLETFCDPATEKDDFFDNDSFWSGSLTWY